MPVERRIGKTGRIKEAKRSLIAISHSGDLHPIEEKAGVRGPSPSRTRLRWARSRWCSPTSLD